MAAVRLWGGQLFTDPGVQLLRVAQSCAGDQQLVVSRNNERKIHQRSAGLLALPRLPGAAAGLLGSDQPGRCVRVCSGIGVRPRGGRDQEGARPPPEKRESPRGAEQHTSLSVAMEQSVEGRG